MSCASGCRRMSSRLTTGSASSSPRTPSRAERGSEPALRRKLQLSRAPARGQAPFSFGSAAKTPAIKPAIRPDTEIFHNIPYANHHCGAGVSGLEPGQGPNVGSAKQPAKLQQQKSFSSRKASAAEKRCTVKSKLAKLENHRAAPPLRKI